jgi:replication factor A1
MDNYNALVERIASASGLEKAEIERRVEAKRSKLSGLISKEGAAQIISAELNVSFDNVDLKISEIVPGMKKVNVVGKVINLFPVREFERNGKQGKVLNFILADETSNTRVVLWDTNHISLFENGTINKGDVVEIKNGSTRDSEIHLGSFSEIKKSDKILSDVKTEKVVKEETIENVVQGQSVKVRGVVVQMFAPRFFNVCPDCGKKVTPDGDSHSCAEHGKVLPKERSLVNFVLDDGTESIRVVLFSEQLEKLVSQEALKTPEGLTIFREDLLGSELWVSGNIRKNQLFNNIEIIGQDVEKVNPDELVRKLEA